MTIALPVVTNAKKQLRPVALQRPFIAPIRPPSGRIRLLSASSTAQIRRNDGLFNDCHGRDRLNGVVADTAFHDLPAPEPQHFDFGSLERSTRKNDVGRFNLGKVAHGEPQPIFESKFRPQTIFLLEKSDPFRTSLAPSNRVALNDWLLSSLQPMESPHPFSMGSARKEYTVIRVRNDHQTRLRNLAARFEFIGNDVSYAFCALKIR